MYDVKFSSQKNRNSITGLENYTSVTSDPIE